MRGKSLLLSFLFFLLVLNLFQAGFTELDPDECYYWMYARQLDWGYFDHPPMIAALIKPGYILFPNELGVRIFPVFLNTLSVFFLWILVGRPQERKEVETFVCLVAGIPILQVFGFIATPDNPLLFFTILYFLAYRYFWQKNTIGGAIFLGVCMAALLYSKYHGLLIILFTVFSNWRLFLRKYFYLAGILGVLLFLPHLYWQYLHDFPSFRYHLSGRDDVYKARYTFDYLLNQLLIFSPLLFPLFLFSLTKTDRKDVLDRIFLAVIIGFWAFFFYTTFKGHVEPQWTAVLAIPFLVLSFRYSLGNPDYAWWLKRLALLSAIILLALRVFLVAPLLDRKTHFHNRDWVAAIDSVAKNRPVIFENSYREASKFTFYSGRLAHTFTNHRYRKNQFDLWDWERPLHNKAVLFVGNLDWECEECKEQTFGKYMRKRVQVINPLQVAQDVTITTEMPKETFSIAEELSLSLEIHNPYGHPILFSEGDFPLTLVAIFIDDLERKKVVPLQGIMSDLQIQPGGQKNIPVRLIIPANLSAQQNLYLGLKMGTIAASIHSSKFRIKIEDTGNQN